MNFATIPDYLRPHLQHPLLSAGAERSLIAASQSGDRRARERVLQRNYRYCWSEAVGFQRRYPYLELGELFQSALLGLNEAIDRFDPDYDTRLIIFAKKRILFEMQRDSGVRKKKREYPADPAQFAERLISPEELVPGVERLELLAQLRQKRREIWKALQCFPKQIRKLIIWRLLGKTFEQLGDLLGFSDQTASNKFKQYFPAVLHALVPPKVICPPRRSLRRVLTRRTPRLRLSTAAVRPSRSRSPRPSDRVAQVWPQVKHRIVRFSRPGVGNAVARLKRSPLASQKQAELRLLPLPISSAIRSLVGRLIGMTKPLVFQEQSKPPEVVAPVSSSQSPQPTVRGSPERSPPCSVVFANLR